MEHFKYLVIGAGISGLAFARHINSDDLLVLEKEDEIGGYCRTVSKADFTWDFSGHFFHFKHPQIEHELVSLMPPGSVVSVRKNTKVYWKRKLIDFPFQKNIHQLPTEDFLACLHGLHFRQSGTPRNFREMLYFKFGKGIADAFLVPYNEKLYATDLNDLDVDAMGRFFPHADEDEIIDNFVNPKSQSYNDTFTYPRGGAIQYINALASNLPTSRISKREAVLEINVQRKTVTTSKRRLSFDHLVSSAPLPSLLRMCGGADSTEGFSANKVLVFNLGFDKKGPDGIHWIYYPQSEVCFYRIGFYDNIVHSDRMSLYVEIGLDAHRQMSAGAIQALQDRVLSDLRGVGVVTDHSLIASHSVVMDPAYVHMTTSANAATEKAKRHLAAKGIYSIGRYGSWTYCSIEDNIVEARKLADTLRWPEQA